MNAKIYGIIGSAFMSMSVIPSVSILFNILGLIFLGIAIYSLNKDNEFNYFLIASILAFVATVLFYFKIFAIISSVFLSIFSENPLVPIGFTVLIYFTIYYVLQIISAVFFKKSFSGIGVIYSNRFLQIGGVLLIIGTIFNIFVIGMLIYIIAWLVILLGFFTLEEIIDVEIVEEKKYLEKN